jgi:hypothetical protein
MVNYEDNDIGGLRRPAVCSQFRYVQLGDHVVLRVDCPLDRYHSWLSMTLRTSTVLEHLRPHIYCGYARPHPVGNMPATSPPSPPHMNLSHHQLSLLLLLILRLSSSSFSYSPLKQNKLKVNHSTNKEGNQKVNH